MTEPELPGIPERLPTFESELDELLNKYRNGNLLGQSIALAQAGQEALMRYVCDTPMQAMPHIPLATPGGLGRAQPIDSPSARLK